MRKARQFVWSSALAVDWVIGPIIMDTAATVVHMSVDFTCASTFIGGWYTIWGHSDTSLRREMKPHFGRGRVKQPSICDVRLNLSPRTQGCWGGGSDKALNALSGRALLGARARGEI